MENFKNSSKKLIKENQIQNSLMKYHNQKSKDGERIDISKILEDYQSKFNVPKVMIMKWIGLNMQKSLFNKNKFEENLSQSIISESEYSVSDSSPRKINLSPNLYHLGDDLKNLNSKLIFF